MPMLARSLALLVMLAAPLACASRLEQVVRIQAAQDLRCPPDAVDVRDLHTRNYARDFEVSGCGQAVHYQAACNMTGSCVAYRPADLVRDEKGASAGLTAGPDDLAPEEGAEAAADGEGEAAAAGGEGEAAATVPVAAVVEGEARAVTLRNGCERTVALFIGARPQQSTGRYMTLGSTNMVTLRVQAGESVWLLDADGGGVTSVSVDRGSSEIAVADGCDGLSAR